MSSQYAAQVQSRTYSNPEMVAKASPLAEETNRLDTSLTYLEEVITGLEQRLGPVLNPRPPTAVEKDEMTAAGGSNIVLTLHDFQCRTHRLATRLKELTVSLDV